MPDGVPVSHRFYILVMKGHFSGLFVFLRRFIEWAIEFTAICVHPKRALKLLSDYVNLHNLRTVSPNSILLDTSG
jgi:hypothetical protein